jgi:hypothetical protein
MSTITLGGVSITTGMTWSDKIKYAPVAQNVRRTVGGTPIIDYGLLSKGRPVTLTSLEDQGWLTLAQVESLQALADVPGAVYTLTIAGETHFVMFRHHDQPALEMSPLIPRSTPVAGDWYAGTIKLMTV